MTNHQDQDDGTSSKIKKLVGRLRSSSKSKPSSPHDSADSSTTGLPATHSWGSQQSQSSSSAASSSNASRGNRSHNQARDAVVSLELWSAAYDALHDNPGSAGLVMAYEAIVSQELPDDLKLGGGDSFRGRSAEERLHLYTEITAAGLHKRRGSRTSLADDVAKKMLEQSKDAIESIWPAYPSTAVAWAGICTLTPLLLDPILRQPDMRRGIVHVAGRIPWYMHLAQLLLPASWDDENVCRDQQEATREALVTLYRKVLELQMNCVCATASAWNTAAKNVVGWNSLGKLASAAEDADDVVRRIVQEHGKPDVRSALMRLDCDMELPAGSDEESQGQRTPEATAGVVAGT